MNYVIITTKDDYIYITEDEAKKLAKTAGGVVFIPSISEFFNLSYIYRVVPDLPQNKKITKKNMQYGVLNNGTRVIKKFGVWVSQHNHDCVIYPREHPEIEDGSLMTEAEWNEKMERVKKLSEPKNGDIL